MPLYFAVFKGVTKDPVHVKAERCWDSLLCDVTGIVNAKGYSGATVYRINDDISIEAAAAVKPGGRVRFLVDMESA